MSDDLTYATVRTPIGVDPSGAERFAVTIGDARYIMRGKRRTMGRSWGVSTSTTATGKQRACRRDIDPDTLPKTRGALVLESTHYVHREGVIVTARCTGAACDGTEVVRMRAREWIKPGDGRARCAKCGCADAAQKRKARVAA